MAEALRIAIGDNNSQQRRSTREMMESMGHTVIAEVNDGQELRHEIAQQRPDLIVAELEMPALDALLSVGRLDEADAMPVVLTTSSHSPGLVVKVLSNSNVVGYLVRPFTAGALDGVVRLAHALFLRLIGLERRLASFQRSIDDRKIIEQAKQVLMARQGWSEPEAHRRLQKMASSNNKKLIDLAKEILAGSAPPQRPL